MRPLHVRKEIDGFIADRLLEALWREALWLVRDGVATTEEIDDAIRFGAGLRWLPLRTPGGPNASFPLVPFKGTIQDVAIYDDALDEATIMKHFNNGMGTPDPAD